MESKYNYFKRDISWLSFNYRVLLEALDEHLPLYERINFISIYSSNLEEFYKIRVAGPKAVASGATESDEEAVQSAANSWEEINHSKPRQLDDRVRIYEEDTARPAQKQHHLLPGQTCGTVSPAVYQGLFREEIFPYLQPVPVSKDKSSLFCETTGLYSPSASIRRKTGTRQPAAFLFRHEAAVRQSAPVSSNFRPVETTITSCSPRTSSKRTSTLFSPATTSIRATASKYPVTPTF